LRPFVTSFLRVNPRRFHANNRGFTRRNEETKERRKRRWGWWGISL